MAERKDVVFRRVRGRIVPIRVQKSTPKNKTDLKKAAGGLAVAGAGFGLSAGAGRLAARFVRESAHFENSAREFSKQARNALKHFPNGGSKTSQMSFKFSQSEALKATRNATRSAAISKILHTNRNVVKGAGIVLGTALIGQGLKAAYEGATGKKVGVPGEFAAQATSGAAALAVGTSYFKKLGGGSYRKSFWNAMTALGRGIKFRG